MINSKFLNWIAGAAILLSSLVASADTGFHEEGFIDVTSSVPLDSTYSFYLGSGSYSLDLADYGFPEYFISGSLGVSVSQGSSSIANFVGEGSYSLTGLSSGLYTFYVYGNANNDFGVGSYGLTVAAAPVPEPNSALLLGSGIGLLMVYARRRKPAVIATSKI
ncbi:hypothetical protein A7981_10815 [Methylovorus sp. MM2]|uniref:PEP-CTERM sorting domain-containing protein n=1 Tax=Methylovorus sp. MM2 TaxID=1848038 RepID=UPI0007DE6598|nr:PEP-CTERM sorting domain-containing protein [Methylovorus sp. MM2]OAM51222.1 hypothetical protein A7981_10815 [Methylovorus sp. MM2]